MNKRLNFRKSAVISMSLALLFGGLTIHIIQEIGANGLFFSLPYLIFIFLGISILRIETQTKTKKSSEDQKSSQFLRSFSSFDSISSIFILAFFSFCEVFLALGILRFSMLYLFKVLKPENPFIYESSHLLVYLSVVYWLFILYVKLFSTSSKFNWLKGTRYLVGLSALVLLSLIIYQPQFFIEFIQNIFNDINNESRYILRPTSIWDIKVWQISAGKVFILVMIGYFMYNQCRNQIDSKHTGSLKLGLISLTALFILLGSCIVYFSPQILSLSSGLGYLQNKTMIILVGIVTVILIIFLLLLNSLTTIFYEQFKGINYSLTFVETKYLTQQNVLFILISLVGLASGILFIFVEFKDYFYWIGMVFLLLITISFVIHFIDNFSFNKESKRFNDRFANNQLSSTNKILLRFILPIFLLPILLISIPDYFSNFLGNKQLNKKIESLQDLGKITSNHHSLEPYIVRDYYKIILDIDSNKVVLDKLDSLKPAQKDSIRLYLENRNFKMNESFRIEKLQYHHDVVFVKNFSKWALLIFILLIFLFYRFKLRGK
jgi:hypothetical protein